ncbi:MAG: ABC transporter ATP-binding protein, partial [Myxococcota bacterium]|nr:ABC transporter ATP-binding protein [Myxococcota bacterium]
MIRVEGLTRLYGTRTAVDGISFEVERGQIVGFLGPNGAGKTTTLRMLTGYLAPTSGRIEIDGIDAVARPVEAQRRIGYMPEGVPLYPEMRVEEYLRHRARLKGLRGRAVGPAVERALEQAFVTDARDRVIGQLSKGYRQRVGLADALVADPPLLVLDEPTSGLDPNQIRAVRALVRSFAGRKTVLLSTHILPEVEASCDRVVILARGRIVAQETTEGLRARRGDAQRVRLVGRGPESGWRTALGAVAGVRSVDAVEPLGEDVWRVRLTTEPGDAVLERLFDAVVREGLRLRELSREATSLEEVFGELTTREPGAEPEVPAPPEDGPRSADEPRGGESATPDPS